MKPLMGNYGPKHSNEDVTSMVTTVQ